MSTYTRICIYVYIFIQLLHYGEDWVPLSYGLVPHLSKKLSKLPLWGGCDRRLIFKQSNANLNSVFFL